MGFTEFCAEFYLILLWFYLILPGLTGFDWVLLGFTRLYLVLPSFFAEFYSILVWFYWVLLGFRGFYRVLLDSVQFLPS